MNRLNRVAVCVVSMALGVLGLAAPAYAAAPSNDLIGNATVVSSLPYSDTSSTVEATVTSDEPQDCSSAKTIWYAYTPRSNVFVQSDTYGSNFDTILGVYAATRSGYELMGCNDDSSSSLQSEVVLTLNARTTYYFVVGGYGGASGSTVFNLAAKSAPDVSVALQGTVASLSGVATVTGTVTCGSGTTGSLEYVYVSQVKRGATAEDDAAGAWGCGDTLSFDLQSTSETAFHSGRATALMNGSFATADFSGSYTLPPDTFRLAAAR